MGAAAIFLLASLLLWPSPTIASANAAVSAGTPAKLAAAHWSSIPAGPLSPRTDQSTVWIGWAWVIWGGSNPTTGALNNGALFNPTTNTWTRMSASPLSPREDALAVWTGQVVILWGGHNDSDANNGTEQGLDNGASYNPVTRKWKLLPPSPLSSRSLATADWTGKLAIFIGGQSSNLASPPLDGATFNPATNTWALLPKLPMQRAGTPVWITAAWSGRQLITWTTYQIITKLPDGAEIQGRQVGATWAPGHPGWNLLPKPPAHVYTYAATSLWVNGYDVLVGGSFCLPSMSCPASLTSSAEAYNAATRTWTASPENAVIEGQNPVASTVTSAVIINQTSTIEAAGSSGGNAVPGDGVAFNPKSGTLIALPPLPLPESGVKGLSLVWTGRNLLAWGTLNSSNRVFAETLS